MLADFETDIARRGVSEGRRRDTLRFLRGFDSWLGTRALIEAQGADLAAYLAKRGTNGYAPNTLRKERHMALSYFAWAFETGHIRAETLLSLRGVKPPAAASGQARPVPYSRKELRELREAINARWPKLPVGEARHRVTRWREGVTPYPRIRKHAIRLQLEAVVALCLHSGLRRGEVFALHIDDVHPDNAYVVVWQGARFRSEARQVPFTAACRERVAEWVEFRAGMKPDHDRPWLNLWASETARAPMARDTFDKLLANYLGREWTFRRLRHTAGVNWLKSGMMIWELQRLLGHRMLKDTLPYGEAIDADLGRRMQRLESTLTNRLPLAA